MKRRKFLRLATGAAALTCLPRFASAFDYPTRPVHLVAGFPPGGIADVMARMISQALSERLGQRFVVENRTGAGGSIAAEYVAKANPDGYTLLLTSAADAWNTAIYDNLNFDYLRDITPVASIERASGVMEVNLSMPANSLTEFIAYAKANPGKINMASAGPGSSPHIYGELFKSMAGVDLITVHYRGAGPAFPDLIGGRVQVMFNPIASSIGYLRAGKLRPLGVTAATRVAVLPDVPTIGEFVPGYEASGWSGIGAPVNTPSEIIAILNKEVTVTLADPMFKSRLLDLGVEPFASQPAEFRRFVTEFTGKWADVIRAAGIKAP